MAKKIDQTAIADKGTELIAMAREAVGDGPETAAVHPDEVPGFIAGGWFVVDSSGDQEPGTGGEEAPGALPGEQV